MKVYGKVTEHRAALFEAICPWNVSVARTNSDNQIGTLIPWPTDLEQLELYDPKAYLYDIANPFAITVLEAGVYDLTYEVKTRQFKTSARHNPECSIWISPDGQGRQRVNKTISFAYLRNATEGSRRASNVYSGPLKIPKDNTRVELDIRVGRSNAVRIEPGQASISFRKLRPLLENGK